MKKWWSGIASSLPTELTDADIAQEMDAAVASLKPDFKLEDLKMFRVARELPLSVPLWATNRKETQS